MTSTHYTIGPNPRVFLLHDGVKTELKTQSVLLDADFTQEPDTFECWPMPDFSVEFAITRIVPWLRLFAQRPSIARRKVWRYMEHVGL